jgi:pimeloyl-ACP methyl ester carboxylesterase
MVGWNCDFLRDLPEPEPPRFWRGPNGKLLAWNEFGDPGGRPIIYYHGWPSSRLQARLAHRLGVERGLRVIALDRPGMGRSDLVRGRRLEEWPHLIEAFADSLKISRFAQLGVSGGGPYALACAAELPARIVGTAVLCGAVPLSHGRGGMSGLHPLYRLMALVHRMPPEAFSVALQGAALVARRGGARFPLSAMIRNLPAADRGLLEGNPEVLPIFIRSFCEGVRQGASGVLADADIYFQEWPFRLEEVACPIRYWHGAEDSNIPLQRVRELVGRMTASELTVLDDLGHFSLAIYCAPRVMDYLGECFTVHG